MTSDRPGIVSAALIVAAAIAALVANILSGVPLPLLGFSAAGAAAYIALARLGDYDPRIACDYIQTGEAAVGSFALFVLAPLLAGSPALPAVAFAALLAYELFTSAVIAHDTNEIAVNGLFTQAILAAAVILITAGGSAPAAIGPEALLLGYFAAAPAPWPLAAAALALVAVASCLARVLRPELLSYSQGPSFHDATGGVRAGIAAGMAIARGLLAAAALLCAGWTCGVGVSARRLSRGAHTGAVMIASVLAFQQAVILVARKAGPWRAWTAALVLSYALYLIHLTKRSHRYDRHQKP